MRFSTGVILSMLSENVFAIEHPNGAHPGSLLARRAVVADTDGPFLQKRNNGKEQEEQEEQAKSKTSVPNPDSSQKAYVDREGAFDFYKNHKPGDSTQKGLTDFPEYAPTQDDEAKEKGGKAYAGLGSGREKSRLANAPGGSSSQVLGSIKKELSPVKPGVELIDTKQSALDASNKVANHFGGREGVAIGKDVYRMLKYMTKTSWGYQRLYKDPETSPFRLELPPSTSEESKERYEGLQVNVQEHIKKHISAIMNAIEHIAKHPEQVIFELEKLMKQTGDFYEDIFDTKSEHPLWLKQLEISGDGHIEDLEMHTKDAEKYKNNLSSRFNKIKEMVEDHRDNPKQQSMSKFLSSIQRFRGRLGIKTKSSKDGALLENVELENDE